jgi:hypothetical protein
VQAYDIMVLYFPLPEGDASAVLLSLFPVT